MNTRIVTMALVLILTANIAQARSFTGQVEHVHDGDTLTVDGQKVRLFGIDAPELAQPGGEAARDFLRQLALGRQVKVVVKDTDVYGRTVGEVLLPDGSEAGARLVRAGHAWVYRKYCQGCYGLFVAEALARWRGFGLWGDPSPMPPWQWRRLHRRSAFGNQEVVRLENDLAQRLRLRADRATGRHRPCGA